MVQKTEWSILNISVALKRNRYNNEQASVSLWGINFIQGVI